MVVVMKIGLINNINNVSNNSIKLNNCERSFSIFNNEKKDTVTFTSSSPFSKEALTVQAVQKSYRQEIADLRLVKGQSFLKNIKAYEKETGVIDKFPDLYHRFFKLKDDYLDASDAFKKTPAYKAQDMLEF